MTLNTKLAKALAKAVAAIAMVLTTASCTDNIAFGNDFLDKAPSNSTTKDSVFSKAEYAEQFLTGVYSLQYYGIPYRSSSSAPLSASYWQGKFDALTDIYHLHFPSSSIYQSYYTETFTASSDGSIYGFDTENVWELVRAAYLFLENVGSVPDMSDDDKAVFSGEAKCLIASAYFNLFKFYGGLPIVKSSFTGLDESYWMPRATVDSTVTFMTGLLDEAAAVLPWAYTGTEAQTETGRWTRAGAMAPKCKILQFAASPLFNSDQPYYGGTTEAEQQHLVWYGGYNQDLWTQCREACDEFFDALAANGYYEMTEPAGTTTADYRYAFRYGYVNQASTEVIHSVRVSTSTHDSKYSAYTLMGDNERYAYTPTQEYIEMFPWSDGTPFDWEKDSLAGLLDQMFVKGDTVEGLQDLQNRVLTRDPRLYETVRINGVPQVTEWSSGKCSGDIFESWVGGTTALNQPKTETGVFATGYANNKYYVGSCYDRQAPQWDVLRMSDLYLTYAEALLQADNDFTRAIEYVDKVRARVGLKGLVECNPDKPLTTDKDSLMEEILRERACELGFENERYFDLIRYKRADIFSKRLHGLRIYRLVKNEETGEWERSETKWTDGDKKTDSDDPTASGFYEPTHFDYERFELTQPVRLAWTNGFDPKWYLFPFPQTEINKGYGLVQNPGW